MPVLFLMPDLKIKILKFLNSNQKLCFAIVLKNIVFKIFIISFTTFFWSIKRVSVYENDFNYIQFNINTNFFVQIYLLTKAIKKKSPLTPNN